MNGKLIVILGVGVWCYLFDFVYYAVRHAYLISPSDWLATVERNIQ